MRSSFIDPGRLRTELALEAMSATPDGAGGFVEAWTEVATVMALVEPVAARDGYFADVRAETITHRITIRHRGDLAAGMRFVGRGRHFVVAVVHEPDETRRYLVCRCREERR